MKCDATGRHQQKSVFNIALISTNIVLIIKDKHFNNY